MKLTIWSTLPAWDTSYYMEARLAHILVLISDFSCSPNYYWYTGETYLSLDEPYALAQEWSNLMSNKIYEVQKKLDHDFHLWLHQQDSCKWTETFSKKANWEKKDY